MFTKGETANLPGLNSPLAPLLVEWWQFNYATEGRLYASVHKSKKMCYAACRSYQLPFFDTSTLDIGSCIATPPCAVCRVHDAQSQGGCHARISFSNPKQPLGLS